jgi:hypothetical protein
MCLVQIKRGRQMAIHLFEVEAQTDDETVIVDYEDPFDGFSILRAVKATMTALAAGELQVCVRVA